MTVFLPTLVNPCQGVTSFFFVETLWKSRRAFFQQGRVFLCDMFVRGGVGGYQRSLFGRRTLLVCSI